MSQNHDLKIKILLLGNGSVGKTSLANRFTRDKFSNTYKPSLGVDFMVKRMEHNGRNVKILVFDTAGQEFISSLRKRYYTGASGAVIVYDITSRRSFEDLGRWVEEVRGEVGNIHTIFVGNKTDLTENREVKSEEAESYAKKMDGKYIESSAKFGDKVQDIFIPFIEAAIKQSESSINNL